MNNTIVVGMGEALWDVLPEGRNWAGLRLISLIMYLSLVWTAVWSVPWAMTNWELRY